MTLAFTGRRNCPKEKDLMWRLHEAVEMFIQKGYTNFIQGGAIGADTFFAQSVQKHKEKYSDIKLITYVPCKDQDSLWNFAQKEEYKKLLNNSDKIVQVSDDEYASYLMQLRNIRMVGNADALLSLWDGEHKGGTWNTIEYATKQDNIKEIFIVKYENR